jgi:hypothetical protein
MVMENGFDWSSGTVELHLLDIGAPIPHFARDEGAIELDPGIQPGKGMLEPFQVGLPGTHLKVEVVLAIALRRSCLRASLRRARVCLSRPGRDVHDEKQDKWQR